MTRARHRLLLSGARTRFLFGQRQPTKPSRFLDELPSGAIQDVSVRQAHSYRVGTAKARFSRETNGLSPARSNIAAASRSRRREIPQTVADGDGQGWRPGNRVRHRRFGAGVVLACQGRGAQLKLVVYFDREGRKTLVPTIAKLEKI